MKDPFISVIVPFYNAEAFLAEAIESVLQQTYSKWELLLIDDGSTDGSTAIAQEYVDKYPSKMQYLMHEGYINKGLTASRNRALQQAKGEYIALLDADDYWLPEKLSKQLEIAEANPGCTLIGGASIYWYSWQDPEKEDVMIKVGGENDQLVQPPHFSLQLYPLGNGAAPCPCSLLIKTSTLKKYGGFEEQFEGIFQMYEDQAFLVKLYLNEPCYMSSLALDKYRQRPQSLVSSVWEKGQYRQVRLFFLKWLRRYINEHNLQFADVHRVLDKALLRCKYPFLDKVAQQWHKIRRRNG